MSTVHQEGYIYCIILLQPRYCTLYNQNKILFAYIYFEGLLIKRHSHRNAPDSKWRWELPVYKLLAVTLMLFAGHRRPTCRAGLNSCVSFLCVEYPWYPWYPAFICQAHCVSATSRSSWDDWLRIPLFFRYASTKKKMTGVLEWRRSVFEQRGSKFLQ